MYELYNSLLTKITNMFTKMFFKFMFRFLYIKRKLRTLIQGECFKLLVAVPFLFFDHVVILMDCFLPGKTEGCVRLD